MVTVVEIGLPLVEGKGVIVEAHSLVESQPVFDISTSGIIIGRLCVEDSPLLFVIIAGGWPNALIALLALDLPVQSVYFQAKLH